METRNYEDENKVVPTTEGNSEDSKNEDKGKDKGKDKDKNEIKYPDPLPGIGGWKLDKD